MRLKPIEEYRRLRADQTAINRRLMDSLPPGNKGRNMLLAAAKEIGYRVAGGGIDLTNEASADRLQEYMFYEPRLDGKSLAQRFLESAPEISPGEEAVLRAAIASETSLYEVTEIDDLGCRLKFCDLLRDAPPLWITDINLSRTVSGRGLLFTRIITVGEISFTSGAAVGFPWDDKLFLLKKYQAVANIRNPAARSRKRYALFIGLGKYSNIEIRFS